MFLPLVAGGCLRDSAARVQVTELQRQVESLRRQADRDRQTMRSVEDRVFVVEDKVDTQSVAAARDPSVVPKLPVVKKEPLPDPAEPITASPAETELPPLRYTEYDRGVSVTPAAPRETPRRAPVEIRDPEERGYPRVEDPSSDRIAVPRPPKIPAPSRQPLAVYRAPTRALGRTSTRSPWPSSARSSRWPRTSMPTTSSMLGEGGVR